MDNLTIPELIEKAGSDVYLDINLTGVAYTNEARKIIKTAGPEAKVYFGRGQRIDEALENLLIQLKKDGHAE